MKIAIISTGYNTGGAAVVTTRLASALRDMGHDARMLTFIKEPGAPEFVECVSGPASRYTKFLPERLHIFLRNGLNRADLFKVSIADTGMPLHRHPVVREADAIILGWVNQGMLSLKGIERLGRLGKPLLWVMHDPWCMTGACHHPYECTGYTNQCGHCSMFHGGTSANDLSRRTWMRKKALYDHTGIHFLAVSNWLKDKCAESSLLAGKHVSVIPNAFPAETYATTLHAPLEIPGVDMSKKLILMGAARLDDPIKGLDYAIEALNILSEKHPDIATQCQAVFFGDIRDASKLDKLKFPYIHTGRLADAGTVARLYAAGTVVLSTSLYETLPTTLIEGQAAGCLPVSFGRGGQSDIITHMTDGYIAGYKNAGDIALGIQWALSANISRQELHQSVCDRFAAPVIADRYIQLISLLLKEVPAEKL